MILSCVKSVKRREKKKSKLSTTGFCLRYAVARDLWILCSLPPTSLKTLPLIFLCSFFKPKHQTKTNHTTTPLFSRLLPLPTGNFCHLTRVTSSASFPPSCFFSASNGNADAAQLCCALCSVQNSDLDKHAVLPNLGKLLNAMMTETHSHSCDKINSVLQRLTA